MSTLPLRKWQQAALADYLQTERRIYTCHATPASGKTQYGLAVATALLKTAEVKQLVVLCHTKQIRAQWIDAAAAWNITLSTRLQADRDGYIFSYQQLVDEPFVAKANQLIRGQRRSLVILDEPHHLAAARAWGTGAKAALKYAHRVLLLSGTLFRHDEGAIPFVTYSAGVLVPDFEYSYTDALKDSIVGPIYFPTFGGETEWQFHDKQDAIRFGDNVSQRRLAQQLNTAISSETWLGSVIRSADAHLERIRAQAPTAGGLIVAKNQPHARAVAEIVETITGTAPEIALSEITKSEQTIRDFASGDTKWIVAVKMISEGVDIPRLRVGIYASNILTELFFRQVVGRLVRAYASSLRQDAYLYIPQHPDLLKYAKSIAEERYHTLSAETTEESADGGVKEVFGTLAPIRAIAEPGEVLNPLQISSELDLQALLQAGFAALGEAEANLQHARHFFEQAASGLGTTGDLAQIVAAPKATPTLNNAETQLLSLVAKHHQATVSKRQLAALSGLDSMLIHDYLAALKIASYVEIDDADQVAIAPSGMNMLGANAPAPLRSAGDIIRLWSTILSKRETALLKGLLKGHPARLDRKSLLRLTDYSQRTAHKIGADLKRLIYFSLAESDEVGEHRLNPKLLEVPFSGY